jgi:hypothetical protein
MELFNCTSCTCIRQFAIFRFRLRTGYPDWLVVFFSPLIRPRPLPFTLFFPPPSPHIEESTFIFTTLHGLIVTNPHVVKYMTSICKQLKAVGQQYTKLTFCGVVDCCRWFRQRVWLSGWTSCGGQRGKTSAFIGLKHRPKRRTTIAHSRKVFIVSDSPLKTINILAELSNTGHDI